MTVSDLDKARNKAANTVRNRAYTARKTAYRTALESAENAPCVLEARNAHEAVDGRRDELIRQRDEAVAELSRQIRALEAKVEAVKRDAEPAIEELSDLRNAENKRWWTIKRDEIAKVEASFADLSGPAGVSVTAWTIPPDVIAEMEAARSAVSEP